jgi:hypothetical protein
LSSSVGRDDWFFNLCGTSVLSLLDELAFEALSASVVASPKLGILSSLLFHPFEYVSYLL